MKIKELEIRGVFEIQLEPRKDERGFFSRTYDNKIFEEWGIDKTWVQENCSFSKTKGTLRGMHFQHPPFCETKIFRVITGEMFFAVLDLRKNSETFGKWVGLSLSAEKMNLLYVPKGCANGVCALTENCNLAYKVDNYYSKEKEDIIKWNDPDTGINWPIKKNMIISEKDSKGQSFNEFVMRYGGLEP